MQLPSWLGQFRTSIHSGEVMQGVGSFVLLAVIGVASWFWLGDPPKDVRRLMGQQTLEDQWEEFRSHVADHRLGSAADVWLVKGNSGVDDRVALFFGYLDDWQVCREMAEMYVARYPADTYSCKLAN